MSSFHAVEILSEVMPKERLNVAQYAEKHRYLSNIGGGHVGLWENEKVPYLLEPMACLTSFKYLSVAVVGPGQSGKTEIAQNWLMYSVASSPGDFLWFMQSDDSIEAFVKTRINKMIDSHDVLKSNMGQRPVDDSLHYKKFMTMSAEFLTALSICTKKHGALLICDEVMTGFRVAYGGAQSLLRIVPDLTTLGKIVGGGLPVGAYGGRAEIMDHVLPQGKVFQAGTLSGNPLATAAGIATVKILRDSPPYEKLERLGARLALGLETAAKAAGVEHCLTRVGSMLTFFFHPGPVNDWESASRCNTKQFSAYFWGLLDRGIYMPCSQFEALFVSAAHTDSDIAVTVAAAQETLGKMG